MTDEIEVIEEQDTFVFFGDAVKATTLEDGSVKLGGYLVRYGDATKTDLTGDYFTKDTDYGGATKSSGWFNHRLPVKYNKKRVQYKDQLPDVELTQDDIGIFAEVVLGARNEYEKLIASMGQKGVLGWSSGTAPQLVDRKQVGNANEITRWHLGLDASLTPTPAEYSNTVTSLKSLITSEAGMTDNDEQKTAGKTATTKLPEKAKENDMENEELKAMLDANNQTLTASFEESQKAILDKVTEQAEAAATKAVEDVLDKLPEVKAAMNGQIVVTVDEADREFKSIGENCIAVANHTKGVKTHPRIRGLAAKAIAAAEFSGDEAEIEAAYKAALGSNEGIPSQGEFLLEPTITSTLLKPMHETGVFSTKVNRLPVGPNSNSGWIPGVDETSRATGSRWGGVQGYHLAEAATKTASKPKFRRINWELHKVAVLQYATDELLRDAGMLSAIINQSSAEELDFMVNDDILNGVGGDRPLGVMGSGALISVLRTVLLQVNHADLTSMWQRLIPRMKGNAQWYINSEVEPQLQKLAFASNAATTELASPFVSYRPDGTMTIFGKPVVTTEFNAALGTVGDILLADMNEYLFWEKGAIEAAMSIHVQFLTDETCFRFVARYDGQSALASAITPYKGSNTQSPFVVLSTSTS